MELLRRRAVHWNFFTESITIPIWEPAEAAWLYAVKKASREPYTTLKILLFVPNLKRMWRRWRGNLGIGCISDYEPQPLLVQSHLGSFAITTVGKITNMDQLLSYVYENGNTHFQEMSGGQVNATELVAALICKKDSIVEGIRYVQEVVDGSMTLLLMTKEGLYAARDRMGRTPLVIGKKENAYCVSFENFAYLNLGYADYKELGPAEIDFVSPDGVKVLAEPGRRCGSVPSSGFTTVIPPLPMRE